MGQVEHQLVPLFYSFNRSSEGTAPSVSNLNASLVIEKQQCLVGQPVTMIFGRQLSRARCGFTLSTSDLYGPWGCYQVAISPEPKRNQPEALPPSQPFFPALERWNAFMADFDLIPGREARKRIPLNRFFDFDQPGSQVIKATTYLSFSNRWGSKFWASI